jgi:hypothetical protein
MILRKYIEKTQVSLQSDKNNGHFTWRPMYIYDNISLNSYYSEECFRQKFVENMRTHFMFKKLISEKRAVCERMWKNMVEPATDNNITRRMRFVMLDN